MLNALICGMVCAILYSEFREESEKVMIDPHVPDYIEAYFGMLAGCVSLTKALLEDRAIELEREEADLRIRW